MEEVQPHEGARGLPVPDGGTLAHEIGQEDDAVGTRREGGGGLLQGGVGIPARRTRLRDVGLAELVAVPAHGGARRGGAAEDVEVLADHVGKSDEAVRGVDRRRDIAPAHAGADHRDVVAGLHPLRPHRWRPRRRRPPAITGVPAGRPRRAEASGVSPPTTSVGATRRSGIIRAGIPEQVEGLARPGADRDVVDAPDVARRGMVDRDLSGEALDHVGVGRQEQRRALPHVRPLVAQPHHLGEAVVAVGRRCR